MRIDGTNGAYRAYGYKKEASRAGKSFGESLAEAEKIKNDRDSFSFSGNKPVSEMTGEEYELYIYSRISHMQKYSPRNNDTMVFISKEGYTAMKSDPEYEKWVLGTVKAALSSGNGSFGKKDGINHAVLQIGASKGELRYESWNSKDLSGPSAEELKRFRMYRKAKAEKLKRYRKVLEENSIKRADKEREHIKGIFADQLFEQKNICAKTGMNRYYI